VALHRQLRRGQRQVRSGFDERHRVTDGCRSAGFGGRGK
jgi:hypothetical protein